MKTQFRWFPNSHPHAWCAILAIVCALNTHAQVYPSPSVDTNNPTILPDFSVMPSLPSLLSVPRVVTSPSPSLSFQGLDDTTQAYPPDTMGAAGTNYVMTFLTGQVRIQSRSGTTISTTNLNDFWGLTNVDTTHSAYDTMIEYDRYYDRWITLSGVDPALTTAGILVGVSATSDPTGSWHKWRIKADAASLNYADHPVLGFNKNWIVVQANMLNFAGTIRTNSQFWVMNKTNLYAGNVGTPTLLFNTNQFGGEIPVTDYDTNTSTMHVIQRVTGNYNNQGYLRHFTITGVFGSEVLNYVASNTQRYFVTTPGGIWADVPADNSGTQLGSTNGIELNFSVFNGALYRNGFIWCAHTIFLDVTNAARAAVQWWQLDPAGGILQRGIIQDASGATNYAYPSIAVNRFNDVLVGFSRFSSNQYVSADYALHATTDAVNTMQTEVVFKAGEGVYWKTFAGLNRWGDYSATVVDPVNDTHFWTIQQYAATPVGITNGSGRWGTWWGYLQLQAPGNDNFNAAYTLSGSLGSTNGNNFRGTLEPGEPSSGNYMGDAGTASMWYKWTAPTTASVTFNTMSTNTFITTLIAAYTGTSVTNLTRAGVPPSGNTISFIATNGVTYYISVDGYLGDVGSIGLNWNQPTAPIIVIQPPANVYTIASNSVTLSGLAIGSPVPTYQWYFNNGNISGATSTNYTLAIPLTNNAGNYTMVANNANGSATSQVCKLTVYEYATSSLGIMNYDTNNNFLFTLTGASNILYKIEASTDFVTWTSLVTNPASFTFTNSMTTNFPYRFFRGVYN